MTSADLQKSVRRSRLIAFALIVGTSVAYPAYFIFVVKSPLSDAPEAWGQFGDYVGGILNPLIALLAFYWLTQSIVLQLSELTATTRALEASQNAQERLEKHAERTARIDALSALLASLNSDISAVRENISFINAQLPTAGQGAVVEHHGKAIPQVEARKLVEAMYIGLAGVLGHRQRIFEKLEELIGRDQGQQDIQA